MPCLSSEIRSEYEDDKQRDAGIINKEDEENIVLIEMVIEETEVVFDEAEQILAQKNEIKEKTNDIYFYMLYHEYGHILEMDKTCINYGIEKLKSELNNHQKEVVRLWNEYEKGNLSRYESQRLYRNLPEERKADEFAEKIYKIRK